MLKILYKYKVIILILITITAYFVYTRPTKLQVCTMTHKIQGVSIFMSSYKDDFSQETVQSIVTEDQGKIKEVLDLLRKFSVRNKPYIPNQPVGRGQKNIISIIFHYKDKNNKLTIDRLEIGDEGKIRIVEGVYGEYKPYTIGWIGKKQELRLYKDLWQALNNLFINEFEYTINRPFDE